jgi:hypothetical protein
MRTDIKSKALGTSIDAELLVLQDRIDIVG